MSRCYSAGYIYLATQGDWFYTPGGHIIIMGATSTTAVYTEPLKLEAATLDSGVVVTDAKSVCEACGQECLVVGADLWDEPELGWFWKQVARATTREPIGEAGGVVWVKAPGDPLLKENIDLASASGRMLFGESGAFGLLLSGGQIELNLEVLEEIVGEDPIRLAEHIYRGQVLKRRADRSRSTVIKEERDRRRSVMKIRLKEMFELSEAQWEQFNQRGWWGKLETLETPGLLERVKLLIEALPVGGELVDRRRFAQDVVGDPHALDTRRPSAAVMLDILQIKKRITWSHRIRDVWRQVGVLTDGIHDGLAIVGVAPKGVILPDGFVISVPPRMLEITEWESPSGAGDTVFVTENPSVLEAALEVAGARVVCSLGTPSEEVIEALRRMSEAGWTVKARGDFDAAGIRNVNEILSRVPGSVAWRMDESSYLMSISSSGLRVRLREGEEIEPFWDAGLAEAMKREKCAGYEEAIIEELLVDIKKECGTGSDLAV